MISAGEIVSAESAQTAIHRTSGWTATFANDLNVVYFLSSEAQKHYHTFYKTRTTLDIGYSQMYPSWMIGRQFMKVMNNWYYTQIYMCCYITYIISRLKIIDKIINFVTITLKFSKKDDEFMIINDDDLMMCCLLCNIYSVSLGPLGFILGFTTIYNRRSCSRKGKFR